MSALGTELKEARLAKGLTLDELQDITKIQRRYLVSIEEGDFRVLPGDFYVRAFIRQYAEAVGLSGDKVLEEHQGELPKVMEQETVQLSRSQRSRDAVPAVVSSKVKDFMPKILLTVFVLAVGISIWLIAQYVSKQEVGQEPKQETKAKVEKVPDSPLDKKAEEPKAEAPKVETPPPPPPQELKVVETAGKNATLELRNNTEFKLEFTAKNRAYIDIRDGNGKYLFTQTLQEGEIVQQDMTNQDVIRLNIGSAPSTEIKINGQVVTYPQDPNAQDHQILLIKNLRTAQPTQ